MELQVGVKILLQNKEGKFLLLRRSKEKYPEVGSVWDIVGGRINPGVPLIDNLRREIAEETKLELQEVPRLVAAQDILKVPGRHVVRLTYVGSVEGQPVLDSDHDEYRWFSGDELKDFKAGKLDEFFSELISNGGIKI